MIHADPPRQSYFYRNPNKILAGFKQRQKSCHESLIKTRLKRGELVSFDFAATETILI